MSIRRKSVVALLAVTGVLVASALLASGAIAAPGQGSATPYTASWDAGGGTRADCSGAHIVNSNTGMVKESETCLLTGGDLSTIIAGTYTGDPRGTLPWIPGVSFRWASDYTGAIATHWSQTFVDNGDGTWTLYAVTYY